MDTGTNGNKATNNLQERRLDLEERRMDLEHSFAKKWLPTLATIIVGVIAGIFGYVQKNASIQETRRVQIEEEAKEDRLRIEAQIQDEREWGYKVVELYFNKRELFDFQANPEMAAQNLRVLSAVSPKAVQGVLDAEEKSVAPPKSENDAARLNSLAAINDVQEDLTAASPQKKLADTEFRPSDFIIYVQYAEGDELAGAQAQQELLTLGYRVPGIEKVDKVPDRLELRYYRPEQQAFSQELVVKLGAALGLTVSRDNAKLLKSSKQLPGGILEVWLPRRER